MVSHTRLVLGGAAATVLLLFAMLSMRQGSRSIREQNDNQLQTPTPTAAPRIPNNNDQHNEPAVSAAASKPPSPYATPSESPEPPKPSGAVTTDFEGRTVMHEALMRSLIPPAMSKEERARVPRVVIATTLGTRKHPHGDTVFYEIPVPIAVVGWRRLGYEPVVALVLDNAAEEAQWGDSPPEAVSMLRRLDVELIVTGPLGGSTAPSTAQILRLALMSHESLFDAELVITTDADMVPVLASYFEQRDPGKAVTVFNADIIQYTQFAMCYVSASSATWREFMHLPKSPSTLEEAFQAVQSGSAGWARDQQVMTERLKGWQGYDQAGNKQVQFVELPKTKPFRLDRICCHNTEEWKSHLEQWRNGAFTAVDFHLFRYSKDAYTKEWAWTKDFLRTVVPEDTVQELDSYYRRVTGA